MSAACALTKGAVSTRGRPRPGRVLVTLDGVRKAFSGTVALDGISTAIHAGELVAIIGPSGAGKTTLLRCTGGATAPTAGRILIGADEVAVLRGRRRREYRSRIGMIYQQFNLVKRLRVIDNVLIGRLPFLRGWRRYAALLRYFSAEETAIALHCLDRVGLAARVWQRTDTLSGGEQQRVAIAKVLAQRPVLILADEPVASLDVANGALVMAILRQVVDGSGLTVVTTLHQVEFARRYADRILGLREGRIVLDGPPAALSENAIGSIFGPLAHEAKGREPGTP